MGDAQKPESATHQDGGIQEGPNALQVGIASCDAIVRGGVIATADALEDGFDNNLYFHALDAALRESLPELAQADTAAETIWRTIQHLA